MNSNTILKSVHLQDYHKIIRCSSNRNSQATAKIMSFVMEIYDRYVYSVIGSIPKKVYRGCDIYFPSLCRSLHGHPLGDQLKY